MTHRAPKTVLDTWSKARDVVDYVIVGAGTAGLALAGRLSEDRDITVLVIEAGHTGFGQESQIRRPNAVDYDSLNGSVLDWSYNTTSQSGLGDRKVSFAAYRTIGGNSAADYLVYTRPSKRDAEVMGRYGKTAPGSGGWGWNDVHSAMQSSVHFEPPEGIHWHNSAIIANATLAKKGPVFLSFPSNQAQIESVWSAAFDEVGIHEAPSPFRGQTNGWYIAPATIEKQWQHRSFSRSAYFDPIADKRSNLQILPNQTVTRIILDTASSEGNRRALGIEYAAHPSASRVLVTAKREVILSAGVVGSPALLQRSGVGAASLLRSHKINVVKDLPGVGQHLQDSAQASLRHSLKDDVVLPSYSDKPEYADTAVAMLTIKDVLGSADKALHFLANAEKERAKYIGDDKAETVKNGQTRTLTSLAKDLLQEKSNAGFGGQAVPAIKLSLSTVGNQLGLTASLQEVFSRGSVQIKSNDAFEYPDIDAGYMSHPADRELLVAALAYARKLAKTDALSKLIRKESTETRDVKSVSEWYSWLNEGVFKSPFPSLSRGGQHASSTCSMLPESDGGVVDSDLKVYGFSNLRVVDASVLPFSPSSGLLSHVYAIAEIAARKLKEDRKAGHAEPIDVCDYDDNEHEEHEEQPEVTKQKLVQEEHRFSAADEKFPQQKLSDDQDDREDDCEE